ncbi:MAG: hypothetical protein KKG06_04120 [Bacteroidetes bacterium]|nr:hypothetical protein [Bacteroidota bacterium]
MRVFNNHQFLFKLLPFCSIILLIIYFISCERPTDPAYPNLPPNTTIANVPRDFDTLFALQTLHWDGEDDDGYVAGYEYRYITYRLIKKDSIVQPWKLTKETSLTIAFLSDDDLNKQVFQVRAVDNNGGVDPSPAEKTIFTKKTVPPKTEIVKPKSGEEYFAIDHVSDWWQGIELIFTAKDLDEGGGVIEYAWSVDKNDWVWTKDTVVFIPPGKFSSPLSGTHVIRVTSKDNTFLIDPVGDSAVVRFVTPTFDKKILIIDETDENNFPYGVVRPTDAQIDSFYADIFKTKESWDFYRKGMPPRDTIGKYQLIVWHADDLPFTKPHKLPENIEVIKDYLNVGGKFFMSGWRMLKSFAWNDPFPLSFKDGTFVHDYLHIITVNETAIEGDCIGFYGVDGKFSDISIDSLKLLDFPYIIPGYNWGLGQINLITQPGGFTDKIYSYRNSDSSPYTTYRGRATGLRYYGSTFDAVILGFPVFFIKKEDASKMVDEIVKTLNLH